MSCNSEAGLWIFLETSKALLSFYQSLGSNCKRVGVLSQILPILCNKIVECLTLKNIKAAEEKTSGDFNLILY